MTEETLIELLERRFVTADGTILWNDQVKGLIKSYGEKRFNEGYTAFKGQFQDAVNAKTRTL